MAPPLKDYLRDQSLLTDEKRMWEDAGFYVYYSGSGYQWAIRVDGNSCFINAEVAKTLRRSVIERWEKRQKEITTFEEMRRQVDRTSIEHLDSRSNS